MLVVFFVVVVFFFFKQKTAYEMRISDWSSDVCSSDLHGEQRPCHWCPGHHRRDHRHRRSCPRRALHQWRARRLAGCCPFPADGGRPPGNDRFGDHRSEEHTSELQSLMRISYAVFCLKKKKTSNNRCYMIITK